MDESALEQFLKQARECIRAERFRKAEEFARQALELDANSSDAHELLGVALSKLGDTHEATAALHRAIELAPTAARKHFNLAAHLYQIGDKTRALEAINKALAIDPNYVSALKLKKHLESELFAGNLFSKPGAGDAPPVISTPAQYYNPVGDNLPKHSLAFIQRNPKLWDGLLWTTWALHVVSLVTFYAWVSANPEAGQFLRGTAISDPFTTFETALRVAPHATVFLSVTAIGLLALWAVDLLDRLPESVALTAGIAGLVLAPCCTMYLHVGTPIFFAAYWFRTRRSRAIR